MRAKTTTRNAVFKRRCVFRLKHCRCIGFGGRPELRRPHLSRKIDDRGTSGTIGHPRLRQFPPLGEQIGAPVGLGDRRADLVRQRHSVVKRVHSVHQSLNVLRKPCKVRSLRPSSCKTFATVYLLT